MKTPALFLVPILLAGPLALAQESLGTIKVTTKILDGGFKCTTTTDPDAHTAEEIVRDARDKVVKRTMFLLGDGDLAVAAIFYDPKGNVFYKASYLRDGAGRVAESSFTSPDGRYLGKRVFIYGSGPSSTQFIDYDANGQQIVQAQAVPSKGSKKRK